MIDSELQSVSNFLEQGHLALQCLNIIDAREYCVQALRLNPSLPEAWLQYGSILEKLGCYQEAIAANSTAQQLYTSSYRTFTPPALEPSMLVAEAIALKQNTPDYWIQQGHASGDLGQYEAALACFDRAIEIRPDHGEAWFGRSNALTALSRYDDAILSYRKAAEHDSQNFQVWNNFGYVWHQVGNYEQAIAHYDQALFHSPSCAPASNNRGFALFHLGLYDTAIAAYDYALALNPNYSAAYHNRGNALRALGRYEEALHDFDRALAISPDFPAAVNSRHLALDLQRQQNGGQAPQPDSPRQTHPAPKSFDQKSIADADVGQASLNFGSSPVSNGCSPEAVNPDVDQSLASLDWGDQDFLPKQTIPDTAPADATVDALAPLQDKDHLAPDGHAKFLEIDANQLSASAGAEDYFDDVHFDGVQFDDVQSLAPLSAEDQTPPVQLPTPATIEAQTTSVQPAPLNKDQTASSQVPTELNPQDQTAAVDPQETIGANADPLVLEEAQQLALLQQESVQLLEELRSPDVSSGQVNILKRQLAESVQQQVDLWAHQNPLKALELADAHRERYFGRLHQGWTYEPAPLDYAQVQNLLDPHTAILYWHLSHQALTLFILRHNQPPQLFQPLSGEAFLAADTGRSVRPSQRQALELWLNKWLKDLDSERKFDPLSTDYTRWRENLERMLFKRLNKILNVQQICSQLRNVKRLVLIPHRDLCTVPLHALFLDRYTVSYLPSLQAGLQRLSVPPIGRPYPLVSIESDEDRDPALLRGTVLFAQLESTLIRSVYGSLWEESVTPPAETGPLKALELKSGCLRLTGSRVQDLTDPTQSSVVLSGQDRLTLQDFSEADLSRYALICLSAYNGETIHSQPTRDEYIDLTQGLLRAKAASVLSTFWNVKGIASVLIAVEFHRRLLHDQMPPAKALASAQHWLSSLSYSKLSEWYKVQADEISAVDAGSLFITRLQELSASAQQKAEEWGEVLPYAHPYYWAGFAIMGFNCTD